MLLYFAIALIGVLFLLASSILGEVFDFLHLDAADGGVHPLSGKVLATAMTAFGATGMLARYYNLGAGPSALTSGLVALLTGVAVWWAMSALYRQTATTEVSVSNMRDRLAEVTIGIPAGSVGEVMLASAESTRAMIARSRDGSAIPVGTTVRVVELLGNVVLVEPAWKASAPVSAPSSNGTNA